MLTRHVPDSGRQHRLRRWLTAGVILVAFGLVTACGGQAEPTSRNSPSASTADAGTQWAESVCSAANDVRSSLAAIGTDVRIDRTADADAREQVRTELEAQVAAARTSITALGVAIEDIPLDVEGAADLKAALGDARADLETSVQAVSDDVDDVAAATTARDFAIAGAATVQSAKAAATSAQVFLTTVRDTTTTAGGELQADFESAASCAGPTAAPS
jgi:hypothetical protein